MSASSSALLILIVIVVRFLCLQHTLKIDNAQTESRKGFPSRLSHYGHVGLPTQTALRLHPCRAVSSAEHCQNTASRQQSKRIRKMNSTSQGIATMLKVCSSCPQRRLLSLDQRPKYTGALNRMWPFRSFDKLVADLFSGEGDRVARAAQKLVGDPRAVQMVTDPSNWTPTGFRFNSLQSYWGKRGVNGLVALASAALRIAGTDAEDLVLQALIYTDIHRRRCLRRS